MHIVQPSMTQLIIQGAAQQGHLVTRVKFYVVVQLFQTTSTLL